MRNLILGFLYWLASLWFRLFSRVIKYRTAPENLRETMNLNLAKPIVFVLSSSDWFDLFVLDRICRDVGLPLPKRTGLDFPTADKSAVVYMSALLEGRVHPTELTRVIETGMATKAFDAQVIPVSIFWGRDPGQEQSLWKLIFADSVQAGRIRKFFIMLVNGRNVLANFGLPFSFREFTERSPSSSHALKKLTRVLHFHFLRARTAALGPSLLRRGVVIEGLLNTPAVQAVIEHETRASGAPRDRALRYARKCAEEICADYSTTSINFLERVLGMVVWNRVYKGIDVRGLDRVRDLAQKYEIVYMPSHRSHMDYLLMSYSLYHAGLVPPHIAAGVNLNFWPVGGLLRRCGAFYLRRTFAGDKIYSTVFRSYVDSLIKRGYSIEFFPEGGRSRTGRLLAPKTGMLSMVVEAGLRQSARKLALVPVFIGYDKCVEVGSYSKELRGGKKSKESAEGLLKAGKVLTKSYGKPYINVGEPIILQDYADEHLPDWRTAFAAEQESPPPTYKSFVSKLALEHMRRINAAAVANPVGLAAVALLSSPQRAASGEELVEQIGHLIWLLKGVPYSEHMQIIEHHPKAALDWSAPIARIATLPHAWGDLHAIADKDAVALTYNRNNMQHLFALPSLIANFFRTRALMPEDAVITGVRALYPLLRTEFFLRWQPDEIDPVALETINAMIGLGLLTRQSDGRLRRPDVTNRAFSTLAMLGRIMSETLERYCMTALLLADELETRQPLRRDKFEEDCRLLAERMAILTGRDAPEFFDKALFKGYLNTLIEIGLVSQTDEKTLAVDTRIERIAERALELLSDEARQTLLQLLSRRKPSAAEPEKAPDPASV